MYALLEWSKKHGDSPELDFCVQVIQSTRYRLFIGMRVRPGQFYAAHSCIKIYGLSAAITLLLLSSSTRSTLETSRLIQIIPLTTGRNKLGQMLTQLIAQKRKTEIPNFSFNQSQLRVMGNVKEEEENLINSKVNVTQWETFLLHFFFKTLH